MTTTNGMEKTLQELDAKIKSVCPWRTQEGLIYENTLIQLSDVLYVLEKKLKYRTECYVGAGFIEVYESQNYEFEKELFTYNLTLSFYNQSPEVHEFLYKLICK